MSYLLRRQVPLFAVSVIVLLVMVEYFFAVPQSVSQAVSVLTRSVVILAAFAIVIGCLNVVKIHVPRVAKKALSKSDRFISAWMVVAMAITIVVGITFDITSAQYQFIFNNVFSPLSITVWSIMAFYYCGAVFKSLRARTLEAGVLFVAALLVVLRNTPAISAIIPWWDNVGGWVIDVPGGAAGRGMFIGVGIGVMATAVRMLLQIERRSVIGEGG